MSGFDGRYGLMVLILALLAFFPLAKPFSSHVDESVDERFRSVPYAIGNWTGKDEPVDELTYQILETKNIVSRNYENENHDRINLLLVGSEKDRRVAHPPEVCYTSSHFDIVRSSEEKIQIGDRVISVKRFEAQDQNNPAHKEKVLYVYKVGSQFTSNYYAQQLQFALDSLTRKNSQILLIRLSGTTDEPFQSFLEQILPHLD